MTDVSSLLEWTEMDWTAWSWIGLEPTIWNRIGPDRLGRTKKDRSGLDGMSQVWSRLDWTGLVWTDWTEALHWHGLLLVKSVSSTCSRSEHPIRWIRRQTQLFRMKRPLSSWERILNFNKPNLTCSRARILWIIKHNVASGFKLKSALWSLQAPSFTQKYLDCLIKRFV